MSSWTQFFPPKPKFTEADIPDLQGKVYIVTGSNTGLGKAVASILYSKNAKVYIAARSQTKAETAIADIQNSSPDSKGSLVYLNLDLGDLNKVKQSALEFLTKEDQLHVLFNNAGVMTGETLTKTAQGYEEALGVNCLGTFLFTKLLTPCLVATAKTQPANTIRVVWLSSYALFGYGAKDVGVDITNLDYHIPRPSLERYGVSKSGDWALGVQYAKRYRNDGIISVPVNPGNLVSELPRNQGTVIKTVGKLISYPTKMGAFTELWAGLSPDVTLEKSGDWVIPFGRFGELRPDLVSATKSEAEGGNAGCQKFWDWCENETKAYL